MIMPVFFIIFFSLLEKCSMCFFIEWLLLPMKIYLSFTGKTLGMNKLFVYPNIHQKISTNCIHL